MPKLFKMLRDTPHGSAGSTWEENDRGVDYVTLSKCGGLEMWDFPLSTFSSWFSPVEEEVTFTKSQADAIKRRYEAIGSFKFISWLDEHTI